MVDVGLALKGNNKTPNVKVYGPGQWHLALRILGAAKNGVGVDRNVYPCSLMSKADQENVEREVCGNEVNYECGRVFAVVMCKRWPGPVEIRLYLTLT